MVVDALASRLGVRFKKKLFHAYMLGKVLYPEASLYLVKPLTFMNDSGRAVREVMRETGRDPSELLVICDSLDLPPGSLRFKLKGSSAGQKGLESVIQTIGTQEFMRLWVGIGRPDRKGKVVGHVLSAPSRAEEDLLRDAVERAVNAVLILLSEGPAKVMNEFNKKEPPL
jgi:PTH1 family peptidyl-tRNA hydrolase